MKMKTFFMNLMIAGVALAVVPAQADREQYAEHGWGGLIKVKDDREYRERRKDDDDGIRRFGNVDNDDDRDDDKVQRDFRQYDFSGYNSNIYPAERKPSFKEKLYLQRKKEREERERERAERAKAN